MVFFSNGPIELFLSFLYVLWFWTQFQYELGLYIFSVYRLKALETEPYTQAEADRAAGIGSYVAPKKRKMETQSHTEDMKTDEVVNEDT